MSEEGCYCGFGYDETLCPFCQKVERERQRELAALREWKAKAKPFLEAQRQTNQAILNEANYNCVEDELEQEIKTLTELLGD